MDPLTLWHRLEPILGALIIAVTLADVFLTVLYARSHIGLISDCVARLTWHTFEAVGSRLGRRRGHFMSFLGPLVILLIVVTWMLALTLGSALIIHPNMGTVFRALHTETPTDFITAFFVGSHSLVIASENNFSPETNWATPPRSSPPRTRLTTTIRCSSSFALRRHTTLSPALPCSL